MKKILFNPFQFIAGTKALIIGVIVIILTAICNYFVNKPFTFLINWSMIRTIIESLAGWFLFSTLLYILGRIFSKSRIRFIDVLGTQALARIPFIFTALISLIPMFNKFIAYLLWTAVKIGKEVEVATHEIVLSLFLYAMLFFAMIWGLILMFNAFKVSTNLKGEKGVWLFVIALVFSLITSVAVRVVLFGNYLFS